MPLKSFDDLDSKTLSKPKLAAGYLSAVYEECVQDGNFEAFLLALRRLIQTRNSMSEVAEKAGIGRQALYNMLSENGNPQLNKFASVLNAVGLKIKFEA